MPRLTKSIPEGLTILRRRLGDVRHRRTIGRHRRVTGTMTVRRRESGVSIAVPSRHLIVTFRRRATATMIAHRRAVSVIRSRHRIRVTPGDRGGYYDPPPRRRDTAPPPAEPDRPSAGRTRLRQDDPPQDAAPPRRDREPEPRYAEPVPRHERAPEPPQERGNDRDAAAERDARERFPVRGDEPPRDDRAQPSGSSRAEELSRRFADRR